MPPMPPGAGRAWSWSSFGASAIITSDVLEGNDLDLEGAHDFMHSSSESPEFTAAIRAQINSWYANEDREESDTVPNDC